MVLHLFNRSGPKRKEKWPKVTVKPFTSILDNYYTAKDWAERRKRKQIVRRELHKIEPALGLFDRSGNFDVQKWKQFKVDYHVTSATMRVLLEQPGENFFKESKMMRSKNKKTEQLSPYAKAFFTKFLEQRSNFEAPVGTAFFRKYNAATNTLSQWPASSWKEYPFVQLALVDFRFMPGYSRRSKSGVINPFFKDFLNTLKSAGMPDVTEPEIWLWICGDHEAQVQAFGELAIQPWIDNYDKEVTTYVQGKFERLCDVPANSKIIKEPVHMICLTKRGGNMTSSIRPKFEYPNHWANTIKGKYREFDLRINNGEFVMEFYFDILRMICKPGDIVLNAYGGSKLIIAAVVSRTISY
jgi:hypothetical protein